MTPFSNQKITFTAILLLSIYHITNAQLIAYTCYPRLGNHSILSDYGANINESLTQLASLASTSYFNTVSVGNDTDEVNALFYCRYDVSSDVCQSCVESSSVYAQLCSPSVASLQYHEDCTVHYSNLTILSILEEIPGWVIYGLRNVSKNGEFNAFLSKSITSLISDAIAEFSNSSRYFATSSDKYSKLETIYSIAQCIQNLTSSECSQCLENGFGNFTSEYPEAFMGQVFKPSCRLSYMLSSESMSRPYNFTVPILRKDDSTPPTSSPESPDEDLTPPPPSSFADELRPPPPPPSPPRPSTGTRGVPTTLACFSIVLLCFGLFLQSQ